MMSRILSVGKWCVLLALSAEVVFLSGRVLGGDAFVFYFKNLQLGAIALGVLGCLLYFFFGREDLEHTIDAFFRKHKSMYRGMFVVFCVALIPLLVQSSISPWIHNALLESLVPLFSTLVVITGALLCVSIGYDNVKKRVEPSIAQRGDYISSRPSWFRKPSLYTIGIVAFFVIIAALRFINLGSLGYSTDEGSTVLYASVIQENGVPCLDGVCYLRGVPYLYLVAFFTKIFGVTEFWVRVPGVLASLGGAYILYRLVLRLFPQKYIAQLTLIFILCADWHFMLGRYARMYSLFLFFAIIALFAYQKAFFEGRKKYIIPFIGASVLAMVTHQFGLLLAFFILEPLFSGTYRQYKNPWYVFASLLILVASVLTLTKITSTVYTDPAYVSIYDQYKNLLAGTKFWHFRNLQSFNWTYVHQLFEFFPAASSLALAGIVAGFVSVRQGARHLISYFIVCVMIALAIYKIDYALKYIWWILTLLQVPLAYMLVTLYKRYRTLSTLIIIVLLLSNIPGVTHIISRDYGQDEVQFPVLMSSHVEQYHPDDKTPVEYVAAHYQPGDLIVTDYWMQDVYLFLSLGRKSDFFVSRWNTEEFLIKFPYYKLYHEPVDGSWKMSRNGPVLLDSLEAFQAMLNMHTGRIWYITSSDFDRKPHLYISKKNIDLFVATRFADDLVYTGKDGNSRVYSIAAAE